MKYFPEINPMNKYMESTKLMKHSVYKNDMFVDNNIKVHYMEFYYTDE